MDVQDFITYTMAAGNIAGTLILFRSWKSTQKKDRATANIEEATAAGVSADIYARLSLDLKIELDKMRDKIRTLELKVQEYETKCSKCNEKQPHYHDEITQTIILPASALITASRVQS